MSQPFGQQGFGDQPGPMQGMQGVVVPKPKSDIYTAMLGLALLFVLIAIIMLAVVMNAYGWDYSAAETRLSATVDAVGSVHANTAGWLA
ncbi:MAG: hypothetical protein MPJ50_14315 [Pirellulales bacterium]|nr:hypothetical protein [Pirellulales bacterium]